MQPIHINAKTISDAWFQLLFNIFDNSYSQNIQKGSFENEQSRLQYPGLSVYIEHPDLDIVPIIPQAMVAQGVTPPTSMEFIEDYFANYLMNPELAENETYKYASRIHKIVDRNPEVDYDNTQFDKVVEMLRATPFTNQAVIEVGEPSDIVKCVGNDGKLDPPCLRLIDFKVLPCPGIEIEPGVYSGCTHGVDCPTCNGKRGTLTVSVYFRSWDLYVGFPTNLGGIEMLKHWVAVECGFINGPMYAYSAGAHIYGYQEDFARIRTMKTLKESK